MGFEEYKGSDGVKNQSTVTGDTVSDALETLSSAITAEDIWDRTGTTIEPKNAGDDVDIGTGSIAVGGLTFNFTGANYEFDERSDTLTINSTVSGTESTLEIFSKDGDATDAVGLRIYHEGTKDDISDRSRLVINSNPSGYYQVFSEANGTGILLPIILYTEGNANQLYLDTNGNIGIGTDSLSSKLDIVVSDTDNVSGIELNNNDTTNNPDTLVINNTTSGADTNINGNLGIEGSTVLADDGTITLPTGVAGWLYVWEDIEWMHCHITSAGVVTSINGSANTAIIDSDGKLCVYDGGTGAIIKNRLGAQKTIRYFFKYS